VEPSIEVGEGAGRDIMNRVRIWLSGVCTVGLALALVTTGAHAQDAAGAAKDGKVDGEALYKEKCQVCHLADGNSPIPNMNFADGTWVHGSSLKDVTNTIANGVPNTAMMSWKAQGLTDEQITALAKYVRHFDKKLAAGGKSTGKKKTS
jgi:mono/diheme cytochrome c family protein